MKTKATEYYNAVAGKYDDLHCGNQNLLAWPIIEDARRRVLSGFSGTLIFRDAISLSWRSSQRQDRSVVTTRGIFLRSLNLAALANGRLLIVTSTRRGVHYGNSNSGVVHDPSAKGRGHEYIP